MKGHSKYLWGRGAAAAMLIAAVVIAAPQPGAQRQAKKKAPAARQSTVHPPDTARPLRPAPPPARSPDSTASEAAPRPFQYRKIANTAFAVGERLVFDVNYGYITAGEAVMSIPSYESIDGRPCYRIQFNVNSLPGFSWVFRVEDRYLTFLDTESIAPLKFEQHVREGTYSRDFVAQFDQVHHVARTTEGKYPIPEYVHDIMSSFYYFRTIDFSTAIEGDRFTLFNFYKDKSYELEVRFLGRRELEVRAGTFNTIVVEPLVKEGGLFKSEGRIVVWLTDDELKIPVRVNTKVVIGSIDTELREYSGLAGLPRARIK
jgi:hypothetical protein